MKLLITAATNAEIQPLSDYLLQYGSPVTPGVLQYGGHEIHLCIAGPGTVATTYALTKLLTEQTFDLAIQAGVAGSFDKEIDLGQVVLVQSEVPGDTGAEDHEAFLDIFTLGLTDPDAFPFSKGKLECPLHDIPFPYRLLTVSGLTVNTVSGNGRTIRLRKELFDCQVETMEGAAFHYVCLQEKIPFAQVRAISNYVTPRDRNQWKMEEAINNLNEWLIRLLNDSWSNDKHAGTNAGF